MSTVINKPFNDLSDTGHSSDYDFCSNVLSTYSLCTCSGDDSNATDSAADDNSAEVGKESDGRGVQSVNEQSENTATEAELKEHNELFLESVRELGTNDGEAKSALQFSVVEVRKESDQAILEGIQFESSNAPVVDFAIGEPLLTQSRVECISSVSTETNATFGKLSLVDYSKVYQDTVEEAFQRYVEEMVRLNEAVKTFALSYFKLEEAVRVSAEAHSGESFVEADAELEKAKKKFTEAEAKLKEVRKESDQAILEGIQFESSNAPAVGFGIEEPLLTESRVECISSVSTETNDGEAKSDLQKEVHYSNVATPATAADDNNVVVAKIEETESQPMISVPSPTLCSVPQVPVIVLKQWQDSIEAERAFVKLLFDLFPGSFSSGDLDCLRREFGMSSDLFDGIVVLREMTPATDVSISPVVTVEVSIDHLRSKVLEECAIDMSCKKYSKVVEVMHNALVLEPRCTTFMYQMAAALAQLVCSRQQGLSGATEEVSGIDVTHGSVVHYLQLAFHNGETDLIDRVYDDSDFEVLRGTDRLNAFIACVVGEKVATLKSAFPSSRVSDIKYALAECEDDASEAASKLLS
eukprot:Tbor_TRINITY_DN5920_c1_g1::TRINITY_DN5920_c1_g1_i1::g.19247::m.19247